MRCYVVAVCLGSAVVAQEIVYEADRSQPLHEIRRPLRTAVAFWPDGPSPGFGAKHPFIERYAMFNCFGANPEKPQYELYHEGPTGTYYTFDYLTQQIQKILDEGLEPYLVLGNCPIDLATDPEAVGELGVITVGPTSWEKYFHFTKAFFNHLADSFGVSEANSWDYRFMTEPDNPAWWTGRWATTNESVRRTDWLEFYERTLHAARQSALDIEIAPGNFLRQSTWIDDFAGWIQNGPFVFPADPPPVPPRITISFYLPWRIGTAGDPGALAQSLASVRSELAPYSGFAGIPLGVDEGYIGIDENSKVLWSRLDGTELGGAYFAELADVAIREQVSDATLWNPGRAEVHTPFRNVMMWLTAFDGTDLLTTTQVSGSLPAGSRSRALVASAGSATLAMLVHSHNTRGASGPEDFRLVLHGLTPGPVTVTQMRVDQNKGNYRTVWQVLQAGIPREENVSEFDVDPLSGIQGTPAVWTNNLAEFQFLAADMLVGTSTVTVPPSGTIDLTATLPPNAVHLFVIEP